MVLRAAQIADGRSRRGRAAIGGRLQEEEVLLLWRALLRFRSGREPRCAVQGTPPISQCPIQGACPRWAHGEGEGTSASGSAEDIDDQQDMWPCNRLLDLLDPEVNWIGRRGR